MRRNRFVPCVSGLESKVVMDAAGGSLPPVYTEMPKDETLYPGPDIDRTEAERKAMEASFTEIIRNSMDSDPYTGPIPAFPPPGTPGNPEPEQSYYDWITEGVQNLIEAISPPIHPIMITP